MAHRETLDCPCRPETRDAVGGGRVTVHRPFAEGRETPSNRATDRLCKCGVYHAVGDPHLA